MPLFAAYGAHLDPALMSAHCPHSPLLRTGWLTGWRLTFGGEEHGWDGALVTIVEDPDESVFVGLYDLTAADQAVLDQWEGHAAGLYRRLQLRVSTEHGGELAWSYVLDGWEGGLPAAHVISVLADAAEAAGAPEEYVTKIRHRPCRSSGL